MSFNNLLFLPFLFIVVFLYFTLFRKKQWILLLLTSIIFYLFNGPKYIVFIILTTVSTYFCARMIGTLHNREKAKLNDFNGTKAEKKEIKAKFTKLRKRWLILDIVMNIIILGILKYTDFTLELFGGILGGFGISWFHEPFNLVLPLGISFYTFITIGYILDVYWKRYMPERNLLRFATFAFYFPHIAQGPISRYPKLGPQLFANHKFDYDRMCKGLQLILWGYFEKMVIADRLAIFANNVYADWYKVSGLPLIIAIIFFSVQIYMDFAGYVDIARGVSIIFGIELEKNFWHPYFSKTMPEFWRRWHITLGAWFKDYLLYPISMAGFSKKMNRVTREKWGNDVSRVCSSILPTAVVWIVTGIWHGASTSYVLWGLYHGTLIVCSTVFEKPIARLTRKLKINTDVFSFRLFQMTRTFILSAIGRIFFISEGLSQAVQIMKRTFTIKGLGLYGLWDESLFNYGLDRYDFMLAFLLCVLLIIVGNLQERFCIRDELVKQNLVFRWFMYFGLIFTILIFGIYGTTYDASAFVYGQF